MIFESPRKNIGMPARWHMLISRKCSKLAVPAMTTARTLLACKYLKIRPAVRKSANLSRDHFFC